MSLPTLNLFEEVRPDWLPRHQLLTEKSRLKVSIYALGMAIICRMNSLRDFIIDHYKSCEELNLKTSKRGLTPLHLAVMSDDIKSAKMLIFAGANVKEKDKQNWTPLHHAALRANESMIRLLLSYGADRSAKTIYDGTYENILKLAGFVSDKPESLIPLYFNNRQLTKEKFKELTSAEYIDENLFRPNELFEEWFKPKTVSDEFSFTSEIRDLYLEWLKKPTPHYLSKVTFDSQRKKLLSSPGLGLFAKAPFKPKQIIGEYQGTRRLDGATNSYTTSDIDSLNFRNEIPHINDGFINTVMVPIHHTEGLPTRSVFVTAEPIKPSDQFCWNYSYHKVKLGPYIELRPKEVREFIQKESDTDALVKALFLIGTSGKLSFEDFIRGEKFRYILETPSVLFLLGFEEVISFERMKKLHLLSYQKFCIPLDSPKCLLGIPKMVEDSLKIKSRALKQFPSTRRVYDEGIQSLPAKVGIEYTLQITEHMNKEIFIIVTEKKYVPKEDKAFSEELKDAFDDSIKKVEALKSKNA